MTKDRLRDNSLLAALPAGEFERLAPLLRMADVPVRQQVYRPESWNQYQVSLNGSRLKAWLNGVEIHDLDLATESTVVLRHNGVEAPPIRDRPARGHIGFQELSRDGSHVEIRDARIQIHR